MIALKGNLIRIDGYGYIDTTRLDLMPVDQLVQAEAALSGFIYADDEAISNHDPLRLVLVNLQKAITKAQNVEDLVVDGTRIWIGLQDSVDMVDITRISGNTIFTPCEVIKVSHEVAIHIKALHREFKVRKVLEQIVKVSDTTPNQEECLPHNALAAVARDAKALIKFLSE